MQRLSNTDGSWMELLGNWQDICKEFDEDLSDFMPITIPTLQSESVQCEGDRNSGVFAYRPEGNEHEAICFLNATNLKGWDGRVLRVRHLTLSPRYDFGAFEADRYAQTLSSVVTELVSVAEGNFRCKHVKIHFRSPADVRFFSEFAAYMSDSAYKNSVETVGSWLHITLA